MRHNHPHTEDRPDGCASIPSALTRNTRTANSKDVITNHSPTVRHCNPGISLFSPAKCLASPRVHICLYFSVVSSSSSTLMPKMDESSAGSGGQGGVSPAHRLCACASCLRHPPLAVIGNAHCQAFRSIVVSLLHVLGNTMPTIMNWPSGRWFNHHSRLG